MGCMYMDHEEKRRAKMAPRFLAHNEGAANWPAAACREPQTM